MTLKIYLVFIKYRDDDPAVSVNMDKLSAIDEARNKLLNNSNHKTKIREFEVLSCPYFGVNLYERIMAWVEEREVPANLPVFTTSSSPSYFLGNPLSEQ